jgi:predicted nucleotidyltransferase component of viral defense system
MENNILTPRQSNFLKLVGADTYLAKNFYLTGGTALAAFYLHHRLSEDLDFFSETEFEISGLDVFFKRHKPELGFQKIDFQQSFNRNLFFLDFGGEVLKVEFTYFPFPRIEMGVSESGVQIDSLIDIAADKLFSIYQRSEARDYIDLYVICQKQPFLIKNLIALAKIKFDWHIDPVQLATQFVKAETAKNYPRMLESLDEKLWQNFFKQEALKLKPEILQ